MTFTLLEIELNTWKSISIISFDYRSLFYFEWSGGLQQIDLFFLKIYLDEKWEVASIYSRCLEAFKWVFKRFKQ